MQFANNNFILEDSSRNSQARTSVGHPNVGDKIGIITKKNFHLGTLEAIDETNDAIYLKNGILNVILIHTLILILVFLYPYFDFYFVLFDYCVLV